MVSLVNRYLKRIGNAALVLCVSVVMCGCTIGSKSASVDSTSRMPWFGLELKERRKNADGPAFREIRSDKETKARIDTLGLFSSSGPTKSPAKKVSMALPTTDGNLDHESNPKEQSVDLDFR